VASRKSKSKSAPASRFIPLACVGLALLCLITFANSLGGEFLNWDDDSLVSQNSHIRSLSSEAIGRMFSEPIGFTYQPLRLLSYAMDYQLWGDNPVGYHAMNLLLHSAATVLLFLTLRLILCELRKGEGHDQIALFAAALFAIHPVNVESVAWIASRKYGLLATFGFAGFYCFLRAVRSSQIPWLVGAALGVILAALSSPFAIVLPPLFLFTDFAAGKLRQRWRWHIPILVVFAIFAIVFSRILVGGTADNRRAVRARDPIPVLIGSGGHVLANFARNLALPFWLNNKYSDNPRLPWHPSALLGLALAAAAIIWGVREWRRDNPLPGYCLGWFAIAWAPVSNLIPISARIADRYLYLPAVGLFLGFALLLARSNWDPRRIRIVQGVIVAIFVVISMTRNQVWHDSLSLWTDSVSKSPTNPVPSGNLGHAYLLLGDHDNAREHLARAVQTNPGIPSNRANLGHVLLVTGDYANAAVHFAAALTTWPEDAGIRNNYGSALFQMGKHAEAREQFFASRKLNPSIPETHANLAKSDPENAIAHLQQAIACNPDYVDAHFNLGRLLTAQPDQERQAVVHYQTVLRLIPGYAPAHNNLGTLFLALKDAPSAAQHFRAAIAADATHVKAMNNLGNALLELNDIPGAIASYKRALALSPRYISAYYNLGLAYEKSGDAANSAKQFQAILAIDPNHAAARQKLAR
jgi:tetratricopeptide (TPR) repeat protein